VSRIDDLITEFAPNGVECKALGEAATYVRGVTFAKTQQGTDGDIPVLRANNITLSGNTLNFDDVIRISAEVRVRPDQRLYANDILICTASGSRSHVGKVAYIHSDLGPYVFGGFMGVLRAGNGLEPRFLFHALAGGTFARYLDQALSTSTINNLNSSIVRGFRVPMPPLAIQRAIVSVLDNFTQLEAELEAELEARRCQYAQLLGSMLDFDRIIGIRWETLGDIASVRTGQAPTPDVRSDNGSHLFINAGTTASGRAARVNTTGDTVTIPSRGQGGVGVVGYQPDDFWCGPLCYRVSATRPDLTTKFLYYFLKSIQPAIRGLQQTGGTPALNRKELILVKVPLPPRSEQEQIVAILDKFDALVNDLSFGLPAELAARRKQYEYYRDRLLTFEELAA
jgi:type I restriction enzyme S subunit